MFSRAYRAAITAPPLLWVSVFLLFPYLLLFCYSFWSTHDNSLPGYPNNPRPAGNGKRYRISVEGPGVTPDLLWEGPGLHDFNPASQADVAYERNMDALFMQFLANDKFCPTQR